MNDRAYDRAIEHDKPIIDGLRSDLASVRAVTLAVNHAAAVTKARVETAQSAITKGADHATADDLARLHADYASLRVRYEDVRRATGVSVVPGVPSGPGEPASAPCAVVAIPTAQLVDFAEQGDEFRAKAAAWQAWYAAQAAIDRTGASPPQ